MTFMSEFFSYMKKRNITFGILIIDIITYISFLLSFGIRIIFWGDIQLIIGTIIGVYFSLKFRKAAQTPLKFGIIVGIAGSLLSVLTLSLFQMAYALRFGIDILISFLLPGIFIGPFIGFLIGYIFKLKSGKKENLANDDFYNSLKE